MLRIIIVDDSYIELNGLVNCIDWEELQITIVDTASDGQEALLKVIEHKPDILLSDIKMPILDGIALTEEIRRRNLSAKVIFLSAFEDFDYARKGIELGVIDYIMKPVRIQELKEKIQHAVDLCIKEKEEHISRELIEKQLQESLPLLKDKFIIHLLHHVYEDAESFSSRLNFLNLKFNDQSVCQAVLIGINFFNETDQQKRYFHLQLIQHIINSHPVCISTNSYCLQTDEDHLGMIFFTSHFSDEDLDQMFEEISTAVLEETGLKLIFFIGRPVSALRNISISFLDAQLMEKYRLSLDDSMINYHKDIELLTADKSWNNFKFMDRIEDSMTKLIVEGNTQHIQEYIMSIFNEVLNSRGKTGDAVFQNICAYVYLCACRIFSAMNYDISELFEQEHAIERIHEFKNVNQMGEWLSGIITSIISSIASKRSSKNAYTAERMICYMQKHCGEELSLNVLSDVIGLSPNYLGVVFKNYVGMSFLEYLTKIRMEKAKGLLENFELRIYEIAYMTGFQNVSYFSAKFKKQYNVTPKEYRELMIHNSDGIAEEQ